MTRTNREVYTGGKGTERGRERESELRRQGHRKTGRMSPGTDASVGYRVGSRLREV